MFERLRNTQELNGLYWTVGTLHVRQKQSAPAPIQIQGTHASNLTDQTVARPCQNDGLNGHSYTLLSLLDALSYRTHYQMQMKIGHITEGYQKIYAF